MLAFERRLGAAKERRRRRDALVPGREIQFDVVQLPERTSEAARAALARGLQRDLGGPFELEDLTPIKINHRNSMLIRELSAPLPAQEVEVLQDRLRKYHGLKNIFVVQPHMLGVLGQIRVQRSVPRIALELAQLRPTELIHRLAAAVGAVRAQIERGALSNNPRGLRHAQNELGFTMLLLYWWHEHEPDFIRTPAEHLRQAQTDLSTYVGQRWINLEFYDFAVELMKEWSRVVPRPKVDRFDLPGAA